MREKSKIKEVQNFVQVQKSLNFRPSSKITKFCPNSKKISRSKKIKISSKYKKLNFVLSEFKKFKILSTIKNQIAGSCCITVVM